MLRALFLGFSALVLSAAGAAASPSLTILYSFCSQSQCADGSGGPGYARLGNLLVEDTGLPGGPVIYGTTGDGGANDEGVVFQLAPNGDGSYNENLLYEFGEAYSGVPPGSPPSLVVGSDGNFYGTTFNAGSNTGPMCGRRFCTSFPDGAGVIFKLVPGSPRYSETEVYQFCALANCADGASPNGPMIVGANGEFFGTAQAGGRHTHGVLFGWSASGGERVLHSFSGGGDPVSGLAEDGKGDFFGTNPGRGSGDLYGLPAGGKYAVLYRFCAIFVNNDCEDGSQPNGVPVLDREGNLYGTTEAGGACSLGEVFQLNPAGTLQILHSFCPNAQGHVRDGATPLFGLIRDKAGNLYGTTERGGAIPGSFDGDGTVFELVRQKVGASVTYSERVLWRFQVAATASLCAPLNEPHPLSCYPANLALDNAGNLYGTIGWGANGAGAVFKLTP